MNLSEQEKGRVWWGGALKGALKGIPQGLLIGIGAAALLAFVAIPLLPGLAAGIAPFLTFAGAPAFLTVPHAAGAAFFPIPLMIFNTAITMAANAVTMGNAAVQAYHQQKHNSMYEARITALEQMVPTVSQDIDLQPQASRAMAEALAKGPRNEQSFEEAEQQREAARPKDRTLH